MRGRAAAAVTLGCAVAAGSAAGAAAQDTCGAPALRRDTTSVTAFADSTAITRWIESDWPRSSRFAIVELRFDSAGAPVPVRLFRDAELDGVPPDAAAAIDRFRNANGPPARRTLAVLRFDTVPEFHTLRTADACPPQPLNRDLVERRIADGARRMRLAGEFRSMLRFRIRTDGTIDDVTLDESSGDRRVDRLVLRRAPDLRFEPARFGDVPFAAETILPIRLRVAREPARPR